MINCSDKKLTVDTANNLISTESINLEVTLKFQSSLNEQVMNYLQKFVTSLSQNSNTEKKATYAENINTASSMVNLTLEHIKQIEKLKDKLNNVKSYCAPNRIQKISSHIEKYNNSSIEILDKISTETVEIQSFLSKCQQQDIFESIVNPQSTNISVNNQTQNDYNTSNITNTPTSQPEDSTEIKDVPNELQENTLIISEKENKVILPYRFQTLDNILKDESSKYSSYQEIIDKEYTIPMKKYKNFSFARFRETFKLVHDVSKCSLKRSIDLSLEAFFNTKLHPAVITACKNLDEFDIYLSCLEYDELEDFKFFKIVFDVLPTVIKRKERI